MHCHNRHVFYFACMCVNGTLHECANGRSRQHSYTKVSLNLLSSDEHDCVNPELLFALVCFYFTAALVFLLQFSHYIFLNLSLWVLFSFISNSPFSVMRSTLLISILFICLFLFNPRFYSHHIIFVFTLTHDVQDVR